jgi:hypothetical protein
MLCLKFQESWVILDVQRTIWIVLEHCFTPQMHFYKNRKESCGGNREKDNQTADKHEDFCPGLSPSPSSLSSPLISLWPPLILLMALVSPTSPTRSVLSRGRGCRHELICWLQRHKIVAKKGGHFTLMVVGMYFLAV